MITEMILPSLDPHRVRSLIDRFAGLPVAIVGDIMLDHFIFGRVSRISPEAPVPVVEFHREEFRVGGAANVAANVRALGGSVALAAVVGADEHGSTLTDSLHRSGIDASRILIDRDRPTTRKVRIVTSRHQQVARIDYESDREIAGEVGDSLISAMEQAARLARALVVSDYLKGSITPLLMAKAVALCADLCIPLVVDPKVGHLEYFSGASMITPNNAEAEAATQMRIRSNADAGRAARIIRTRVGCKAVLITRGEAGMWLLSDAHEGYLPATAREVADVTGAGDTVVAAVALAMAAGADPVEAAALANAAAGVTVTKFGPASASADELRAAISSSEAS
jgi:D-beta-D-heptose 7-phosphate kinase/D-beta-D-heptose 1-phosphate adenosyltransferase